MTVFRILMLFVITIEIGILTYAFAKKERYSNTVNLFIIYGIVNVVWFITVLISTSPMINQYNAIHLLKFKAFFWNTPTLLYLYFILSLTKTNLKKTLYFITITEITLYIYTIFSNDVIIGIYIKNGLYYHHSTTLSKIIPSLNLIPMLITYFVLIKKYNKNIAHTKSYLILFYLSFAMLLTIPVAHLIPRYWNIPIIFILPFWSFTNSIITFIVVKKLFLSIDYEEFTNELFSNIHDAVLITDKEERIIVTNKIANNIIPEIIKMDLLLMTPCEIFENYDCKKNYKNKIFKFKNSEHEVMISQSIMSNKIPDFNSIIVIKDLSSEKLLQEELIKAQKLQSISVFVGGIAHDFGNILTAILGNTTYMKIKLENHDPEILTILKDNEEIILQAKTLTSQLLEYTKTNKKQDKKLIDAASIIKSSISLALSGTNILVETNIESNLNHIIGNKVQLEQVFNNILINAKQAIKENGKISISIKNIIIENQYIQFIEPGKYLEIIIKDNGHGIAKDKLHKIFTPYFTTKASGNGLGLAVVSSIIHNHNGYIGVESELNKGTVFTIYLPAKENKQVDKENETFTRLKTNPDLPKKEISGKNRNNKVLIMDDEEMILKISEKILKHLNYKTVTAKNGNEVLSYLENNTNDYISTYILDLTIPGGMGGRELAPKIKELYPDCRIIVSSGYSNKDEIINYKNYSFDNKLIKPYTIDDLKSVLENKNE